MRILTGRESLEKRIKGLRERHGPDSLLLKDYERQLAAMPTQPEDEETPDRWHAMTRPEPKQETFEEHVQKLVDNPEE